jgi:muconolactone delta-isomerase
MLAFAMMAPFSGTAQTPPNKITDVMVTLTVKAGITRDQVVKVMKEEVTATVKLYLDGKIRQWYSRADGRGVVFILACNSVEEAKAKMEQLPLAKLNVMDYDYLPLSPLQPLHFLVDAPPAQQ